MAFRGIDAFDGGLRPAAAFLPARFTGPRSLPVVRRLLAARGRSEGEVEAVEVGPVGVRVHRPAAAQGRSPALLWIHGGGLVAGTAAADGWICRAFAEDHGLIVASVDYRLAPEHPYPAAVHDCAAALEWLATRPDVDPDRILVGGASAGGGLAAALAIHQRDQAGVQPIFQVLVYPMLDDRTAVDRSKDDLPVRLWDNAANRFGWSSYLGKPPGGPDVAPTASPGRATDLARLPPAWIGVGTCDLFHDEDVAYAERLRAAGVPCELHVSPGAFHASEAIVPGAELSKRFVASRRRAIDGALAAAPDLSP